MFLKLLETGFGVQAQEIELEHAIKAAEVRLGERRHGFIDALYESTIFEFKSDLDRELGTGQAELRRYLTSRPGPSDYVGVLTDGLSFDVYRWDGTELEAIDHFDLVQIDAREAYLKIDQFLRAETPRPATSADVVIGLGAKSAAYRQSRAVMLDLFGRVKSEPAVVTRVREWKRLLAKVYGQALGPDELFVAHTYLVIVSRLMVARALYPLQKRYKSDYKGVMTGSYFRRRGVLNLAEPDFFAWAIGAAVEPDFLALLGRLDNHLAKYDFTATQEDILKGLYQGLIDPAARHDLGEYYTPDWLAELTLERLGYQGGTLLDPTCGSGTFLMAAVRRLRAAGLARRRLVEAVLKDLAGIDVHPVAVLMAKANLMLALAGDARDFGVGIRLPIFMADTLQTDLDEQRGYLKIPATGGHACFLPLASIERAHGQLDEIIDEMHLFAGRGVGGDLESAKLGFLSKLPFLAEGEEGEASCWKNNLGVAAALMVRRQNSVWAFILKNAYRPIFLRRTKVRYVVGNPPWISYRYLQDDTYRERVRGLAAEFNLIPPRGGHLITQLEIGTVFYRFCEREFLSEGGKMAMVLPRSVIIGAKQHERFQKQGGFSLILDCEGVEPLFKVPCCVVLRGENVIPGGGPVPKQVLAGRLEVHNCDWARAQQELKVTKGVHTFVSHEVQSPWYHKQVRQGATIVPRAFWFVERHHDADPRMTPPYLQSDEEMVKEAKDVWRRRRVQLDGQIEPRYLFYTVLAKDLLPFVLRRVRPIFLPIHVERGGQIQLLTPNELLAEGDRMASEWLDNSEGLWKRHRPRVAYSALERLDYYRKLTVQNARQRNVVIYNASGTSLTAALVPGGKARDATRLVLHGFIADAKTYYLYPDSVWHAHYLVGVLNSPAVGDAIKATMPRGLFGERDVHRRPFEVCRIPFFDRKNPLHDRIARLGEACQRKALARASDLRGPIGGARAAMRQALARELAELDGLVRALLEGVEPPPPARLGRRAGGQLFLF